METVIRFVPDVNCSHDIGKIKELNTLGVIFNTFRKTIL